jgi:transposase-like protein
MSKRTYRRFTVEEKMAILQEAEQPGVTAAEVCRKHGIAPSQDLGLGEARASAATKREVLRVVEQTQQRSRWKLDAILASLGVSRSVYFEWCSRAKHGRLEGTQPVAPRSDALLRDEVRAIEAFALRQPRVGYRKLT